MEGKMMDAISRSAAIADLREWLYGSPDDEFQEGFDSALLGAIDRLGNENINPALDVAPVVHARWIVKRMAGNLIALQCSSCENYDNPSKVRGNFCWNCGARMDGEAE
jgi:hypothetical protein